MVTEQGCVLWQRDAARLCQPKREGVISKYPKFTLFLFFELSNSCCPNPAGRQCTEWKWARILGHWGSWKDCTEGQMEQILRRWSKSIPDHSSESLSMFLLHLIPTCSTLSCFKVNLPKFCFSCRIFLSETTVFPLNSKPWNILNSSFCFISLTEVCQ